jgi:uncharacterized YccA/Bax inhibitor family protein
MALKSTNPYFNKLEKVSAEDAGTFDSSVEASGIIVSDVATASYKGIFFKTLIMIALMLVSGFLSIFFFIGNEALSTVGFTLIAVAPIGAFICAMISMFSPKAAGVCGILYSLFQGLFLGMLTWIVELFAPGVGYAVMGGVLFVFIVTFFLYQIKAIRVTSFFVKFVSIFSITLLISFLFFWLVPINVGGEFGWGLMFGISAILILYGALCLILDFEQCKYIVEAGAPKSYEWFASMGIMISLVWIYIQVLRLALLIVARNR